MKSGELTLTGPRVIDWKDHLPEGLTPVQVVFGRDDLQVGEVQVAVATATARPTKGMLEAAHKKRATNTAMPVLLVVAHVDGVWLFDGDEPLGPVPLAQAQRQLQAVLDEPHGIAAAGRIRAIKSAYSSIGVLGFSNHFLFASYHLRVNVPRRTDWEQARQASAPKLAKRGKDLIAALGFEVEPAHNATQNVLVLRSASGSRRAIAVLLDESENFGQKSATYQLSPEAKALEVASREEVPWVIGLRQSTLRLYPGRDGVGVGQRGQSETYFELDLAMIDPEFGGLLDLIFSAEALEKGGTTEEILDGSGRYAADLGARLRDRVYLGVVPRLAIAVAERLPSLNVAVDAEGLQVAYRLSMRILFRLLFQAYGEATELLPAGRNEHYDANSLRRFVERELNTGADDFAETASSIWRDLTQVWDAISHGNPRWAVPEYGGSLFDPISEEGALLEKLQLPDSVLGPVLQAMLTEVTEDGVPGAVDFRSLQVREFGTIYEGLLESSLSLAESDLAIDRAGVYVPATAGDEVVVSAGDPYFHSASGERKATGSYYTPKVVVDHLIERSVEPALEAHLSRVKALMDEGRDREAGDLFFDFRVADLAMGSAHFLVAAVDKIERGMRDFLTATPVPSVRAELQRLAEKAREALGEDFEAAAAITEAQLLRRQVARRCIYGLDINPLAVELSRLALWIHTFVPGLPMSSLDHGLVLSNSLTGVGLVDEAIEALAVGELLAPLIREPLDAAKALLIDYANASEADRREVADGAAMLARAQEAAAPARAVFDVAIAMRLGVVKPGSAYTQQDIDELASDIKVRAAVDAVMPAHLPYLFPEVFLRVNPGFDALVGNPPWEKVKLEEHQWWGLRIPRLRSMPQRKKIAALQAFRDARPDLEAQYQRERAATDAFRAVLIQGPFPGIGTGGDPDLYQAFAWRFWSLARQHGRTAMVLPRGALSGSALQNWRRNVLEQGAFADVCFLLNNQNWVFPSVHPQYTVGLIVLERGAASSVKFCGPFASEAEFVDGATGLSEVPGHEFLGWSSTAAFPLLPSPESADVFLQMKKSPRFDDVREDWEFRPTTELHSTANKDLYEFDIDQQKGRIPVLAGASFNIWDPNFGGPYAYSRADVIRAALTAKLTRAVSNARSAHVGTSIGEGNLPMDAPRIAFRDVTNQTNSRTTLTCLVPAGVALTEMAPYILRRAGDRQSEAYLLGVMSSIPFDWASRRWVELHLKFNILNALPVPDMRAAPSLSARVVVIAGALAAVDEKFADWAGDVGVSVASVVTDTQKLDMIAELDALVSILYGLSRVQVEHVFATFHRGWDFSDRLDLVLEHYDRWKDAT